MSPIVFLGPRRPNVGCPETPETILSKCIVAFGLSGSQTVVREDRLGYKKSNLEVEHSKPVSLLRGWADVL